MWPGTERRGQNRGFRGINLDGRSIWSKLRKASTGIDRGGQRAGKWCGIRDCTSLGMVCFEKSEDSTKEYALRRHPLG